MTQTTLTSHESGSDDEPADQTDAGFESTSTVMTGESSSYTMLAPPEQRGGQRCCPWCLASPETFVQHGDGRVGCGYCDAVIPVGADWFEDGEKIVLK